MKILVTGSGGFIGSWIHDALVDRGHDDVHGIDKTLSIYSGLRKSPLHLVDLAGDRCKTQELVGDLRPEVLVHLAANAREGASQFQPWAVTQDNLSAYTNVLETCIKAGRLKRVVMFSSMAVYGRGTPPFREDDAPNPVDVYGANKYAMELATEALSEVHGFSAVVVRPHNVFGPRQSLADPYRNVIGIFMNRIMRGEPLLIYGDGEQQRAFSYIEDSLPCYLKLIEDESLWNPPGDVRAYNIGGLYPRTVNQLAADVLDAMQVERRGYPVEHIADRPREVKNAYCHASGSIYTLGYLERVGYRDGLVRMAEWAKTFGPQDWINEPLELANEKTPEHWRRQQQEETVRA